MPKYGDFGVGVFVSPIMLSCVLDVSCALFVALTKCKL